MPISICNTADVLLDLGLSASATTEEQAIVANAIVRAEGAVKRHLRYDPVQRSRTEFLPMMDYDIQGRASVWQVEGNEAVLRKLSAAATDELQVRHVPIRSTPAVDLRIDYDGRSGTSSGAFGTDAVKTEGTDFWCNYDSLDSAAASVCRDGIIRSVGRWPTTAGTVRIVYTAGYTQAELRGTDTIIDASPIWEAVVQEAVRRAKKVMLLKKQTRQGWVAGQILSENFGSYSYTADGRDGGVLYEGAGDLLATSVERLESFVNIGWCLAN